MPRMPHFAVLMCPSPVHLMDDQEAHVDETCDDKFCKHHVRQHIESNVSHGKSGKLAEYLACILLDSNDNVQQVEERALVKGAKAVEMVIVNVLVYHVNDGMHNQNRLQDLGVPNRGDTELSSHESSRNASIVVSTEVHQRGTDFGEALAQHRPSPSHVERPV